MKITITLLCVWATLFLAGCDVKDPIYNTPHPDKGAIVITADWTQRGEGIATPSEYITEAAGASFTLHEPVAAADRVVRAGTDGTARLQSGRTRYGKGRCGDSG